MEAEVKSVKPMVPLEHIQPGDCFLAENSSGRFDMYVRSYNIRIDGLVLVGVRLQDGVPYIITWVEYAHKEFQPIENAKVSY